MYSLSEVFSNELIVHCSEIYGSPNLITQVLLIYCKSNSCYDYQLKMVHKGLKKG